MDKLTGIGVNLGFACGLQKKFKQVFALHPCTKCAVNDKRRQLEKFHLNASLFLDDECFVYCKTALICSAVSEKSV